MTPDHHTSAVRRIVRAVALTPAILLTVTAAPALAVAPDTWKETDRVSPLHALLIYAVIPLSLFVVITLLVYVPSMARGRRYQPGLAWRNEPEWFGGPSDGVSAVDEVDPAVVAAGHESKGGASAHW
ncbi:MAG TPA: hypothetical protein VF049_13405 [Nocardioidaceae bacterium]